MQRAAVGALLILVSLVFGGATAIADTCVVTAHTDSYGFSSGPRILVSITNETTGRMYMPAALGDPDKLRSTLPQVGTRFECNPETNVLRVQLGFAKE